MNRVHRVLKAIQDLALLLKEQRALYTQHMIFGSGSTCTSEPVIEFWRHVRWRSSVDWFVLSPLPVTSLDRGVISNSKIECNSESVLFRNAPWDCFLRRYHVFHWLLRSNRKLSQNSSPKTTSRETWQILLATPSVD